MQLQFLVIDDNREANSRISRMLLQRFPQSGLKEYSSFAAARPDLAGLPAEPRGCVAIAGRVRDLATVPLVRAVRECHGALPLIAMGHSHDLADATQAGASASLDYEAWLMLGPTVERLINRKRGG
jgi:hypothetical protein